MSRVLDASLQENTLVDPLFKKLNFKDEQQVWVLNAPDSFLFAYYRYL